MSRTLSIRSATVWVGALTAAGYLASLLKNAVMAWAFGAGREVDLYVTALLLPLTALGIFELVLRNNLVPELAASAVADDDVLWYEVSRFGNAFVVLLVAATALYVLTLPWSIHGLAPGFTAEESAAARRLAAWSAPILVLGGLAALLGSVLHALLRFRRAAAVPLLANLCAVAAIVLLHERLGAFSLAVAAVVAAAVQLVGLLASLVVHPRSRYVLRANPFTARVWAFLRRCFPYVIGLTAYRLSLLFDNLLASTTGEGRIAALNFATKLTSPVFVIVTMSLFTVLLSNLARLVGEGRWQEVRRLAARATVWLAYFMVPVAVLLATLAWPVVRLLFGRGEFGEDSVRLTAAPMVWFSLALVPQSLVQVYTGMLLAARDTGSVMRADLIAAVCHVAFDLALLPLLGHTGLALSLAVAAVVQYAFLARRFAASQGALLGRSDWLALGRIAVAAAVLAVVARVAHAASDGLAAGLPAGPWWSVAMAGAVGGAAYLGTNRLLGLEQQRDVLGWLRDGLARGAFLRR